ncbi:hypothetical protein V2J56_09115 [Georgenia sp. MJ206]|uniref:HNH endonuclease n=1 Tax=Georgenia wangjunii TaxID=3117730 RepID=UPI002F26D5B4
MGDDAASNGTVLAVLEDAEADDRSPEEVFGYVMLLSSVSAVQWQDFAVTMGQAIQVARSRERAQRLLGLAERAGYGEQQRDTETGRIRFLIKDDPSFIHMITKAEKDWTAQRKADNSNPQLTVQVRRRDGDACRYCFVIVNFNDHKGRRGGTYDHRPPGLPAVTPENLVVACLGCNGDRGQAGQGLAPDEALAAADALLPLQGAPPTPYFKTSTVTWLEENRSILIQYGLTVPPRPEKDLRAGMLAPGVDPAPKTGVRPTAPTQASATPAPASPVCDPQQARWAPLTAAGSTGSTPASGSAPGAPQSPTQQHPAVQRDDEPPAEQVPADGRSSESGYAGSGRDGKGRVGSGRAGSGTSGSPPPQAAPPPRTSSPGSKPRRRGRRGRRSKQGNP